jgi:hypothetical protein
MLTDWQLSPTPAPAPEADRERSPVLARLLEEAERGEDEERQEVARRRAPQDNPLPRPFAYD